MKVKEKIHYFFDSYIIHILIITFIFFLASNYIFNDVDTQYKVNGIFIGTNINIDRLAILNKEIAKELDLTEKDIRIEFDLDSVDGRSKLAVGAVSGELDFVVLEKESYEKFKQKEFFLDISAITTDLELPYYDEGAILIEESEKIKELNYDSENKVMAIISTSKNIDNVKEIIKYIYE